VSHRGLRSGEFIARLVTPMRLARLALALALSFSLSRSRETCTGSRDVNASRTLNYCDMTI